MFLRQNVPKLREAPPTDIRNPPGAPVLNDIITEGSSHVTGHSGTLNKMFPQGRAGVGSHKGASVSVLGGLPGFDSRSMRQCATFMSLYNIGRVTIGAVWLNDCSISRPAGGSAGGSAGGGEALGAGGRSRPSGVRLRLAE